MRAIVQDVRYAGRMLAQSPGFTAAAVLTLALGIGANTAIFSTVDAVLLRPLPFAEPDQLVRIYSDTPAKGVDPYFVNEGDLSDWRARNRSFEQIAAFWAAEFNLTSKGGEPERVRGAAASGNLFSTLGIRPILGRGFTREEGSQGGPNAVILSDGLWRRRFGADRAILGTQIGLQNNLYTVVGVLPAAVRIIEGTELWIPQPIRSTVRGPRYLEAIGKLKPGVSIEQARGDLESISWRLEAEFPKYNQGWGVVLVPIRDQLIGAVRGPLLVLLGAVGVILLIACANVANLQLARAESRQREFAVRAALGAGGPRLARQLLMESLALSLPAGALGLLLAFWGVDAVGKFGPRNIPRLDEVSIDARVLAFTLLASVFSGILFGLAPLLRVLKSGLELQSSGSRGVSSSLSGRRVRALLVVSEVALAVALVNGAGLLLQSFSRLMDVKPGFEPENVITADVGLPYDQYQQPQQVSAFYASLTERLAAERGVRSVGATTSLPLRKDVDYRLNLTIKDRPRAQNPDDQSAFFRMVTTGYFPAMGIPLRAGRDFTDHDDAQAPGVVVINKTLARRYWPGENPIGKRLGVYEGAFGPLGDTLAGNPQIVGIVTDVRQAGLDQGSEPAIYFPHRQAPFRAMTLVVRATSNPASLAETIRREVKSLDKSLPVSNVATLEQTVSTAVAQPRFRTMLLSVFAALALLLASIGIYGVTAYTVSRRIREIGIRVALGAQRGHVLRMVARQGFGLVAAGILVGTVASLAAGRLLSGLLFGVTPADPLTLLSVPLLFAAVALAACMLPARRALRVDPMVTLRYE